VKPWLLVAAALLSAAWPARAAVAPAAVEVAEPKALVGQRLPFVVALRSPGPFDGTASFTLPQIDGTVILKLGSPTVSSEPIDGEDWFVKRHEFALFSQRDGPLQVPPFAVRFGSRQGFVGPVSDVEAQVPGFEVAIERPPGTDAKRFLVTTPSLTIEERWQPAPEGEVKAGAVFKRRITQTAEGLSGMALAPPTTTAPPGMRVYAEAPRVEDSSERGQLVGRRSDTLSYVVQQPGDYRLPAIRYEWWNLEAGQLEAKLLPARSFLAPAPPSQPDAPARNGWRWWAPTGAALIVLVLVGWLKRDALRTGVVRWHGRLDPPAKRAERALLRACRRDDAPAAYAAWLALPVRPAAPALDVCVAALARQLYGDRPTPAWRGHELAAAFADAMRQQQHTAEPAALALPPLNG
jgi:hypothetical protein